MNPFEYLNAINTTKKDIMVDEVAEKEYNAFMVNRGLSYFSDTVLIANEMNLNHHLDNRLQFDFFINIIKKKKRFSKWLKARDIENLEIIKQYYGYSDEKAKSVLSLFDHDQIDEMKNRIYKGGKRK
jgi:Holliday junction resolvase RusA-like endonuclease